MFLKRATTLTMLANMEFAYLWIEHRYEVSGSVVADSALGRPLRSKPSDVTRAICEILPVSPVHGFCHPDTQTWSVIDAMTYMVGAIPMETLIMSWWPCLVQLQTIIGKLSRHEEIIWTE
jgi:hypothetical protein